LYPQVVDDFSVCHSFGHATHVLKGSGEAQEKAAYSGRVQRKTPGSEGIEPSQPGASNPLS
jgi:hypothetical protein